jgi:MoxR-like ATPase
MPTPIRIDETLTVTMLGGHSLPLHRLDWKTTQVLAEAMGVNRGLPDRGRPSKDALAEKIRKHVGTYGTWEAPTTPTPTPTPLPKGWSDAIPNCPRCGRVMVKRHRRDDPSAEFWGCPNYPSCKGLRPITWEPDAPKPEPETSNDEFPATFYCPTGKHPSVYCPTKLDHDTYGTECAVCGESMQRENPTPTESASPEQREYITQLEAEVITLTERAESAESILKAMEPVSPDDGTLAHEVVPKVLSALQAGLHVYLSGIPGTGKTEIAGSVSRAMGLRLRVRSCYAQMTESKLFGFIDANGNYHRTSLRDSVEYGGVYCLDEMDNGNSNLTAALNALMSNPTMPIEFPDGEIERHPDFRIIATANTWGTGPTADFMGRNQMDKASMDRFCKIPVGIDDELESALTRRIINDDAAETILSAIRSIRERIEARGLRILLSPRATFTVAKLMHAGWTMRDALMTTSLATIDANETVTVESLMEGIV